VRGVPALLALLLLSPAFLAPQPARLTATFIGNMAFAISDGKSTLYTDFPYESGAFGYMRYDFDAIPKAPGDALCLITHGHRDHFDAARFEKMDAMVIAPPELAATLPKDRVIPFSSRMVWNDVAIEAFKTPHGSIDHASYFVTWKGLRLYFTGDTDSTREFLAARDLDAAFVSPWLLKEVRDQGGRIDARRVIVYHHRLGEAAPPIQNAVAPHPGDRLVLARVRP
jgi:L-ascorbate metabolism protein UlaG (beta-lactamase superfamily)